MWRSTENRADVKKAVETLWGKADDAIGRVSRFGELYDDVPEELAGELVSTEEFHFFTPESREKLINWLNRDDGPRNDDLVAKGDLYQHADGGVYVLHAVGKLKDAETGEWTDSVSYYDVNDHLKQCLYTRTRSSFEERFKPIADFEELDKRF